MRIERLIVVALALLVALGGMADAADAKKKRRKRPPAAPRMQLISKSAGGGFPNGPSHDGAFSQDRQLASLVAFDSDATNIVKNDPNGVTDVFLVRRKRPYSLDGEPWRPGKVTAVSRTRDGTWGDGPSYLPDIDGNQLWRPTCVAFISEADNLVPGDTNGVADAFVKNVRTGSIRRVSVGPNGEEANGATYDVKVDAHCDRVAFVSDATNLALTGTDKPAWQSAVTGAPAAGNTQVYVRILDGERDNDALEGLTFLASAVPGGEAGNGDSYDVAFARAGGGCGRAGRCGAFSGEQVLFASTATNLGSQDTNGASDVYRRSFDRRFVRMRFAHPRVIDGDRVKSTIVGVGPLRMSNALISVARGGGPGDGASDQPAATDTGHYVVFRTAADDILPGDTNRTTDIVRVSTLTGKVDAVSRTRSHTLGNGPSSNPAIGRTGLDVVFESGASFDQNDKNCAVDIYHIDFPANNQILSSLDSRNEVPNAPYGSPPGCPPTVAAPAVNPATSYYLNYTLLESSYPLLDRTMARKVFAGMGRDDAARRSNDDPGLHQVYLRFLSPR